VTINGPGTNLTIGNLTTNQYLTLNYTASASDVFVLDLQNKTVTLNGTPARNFLSGLSQWFMAQPGVNQFYFSGTGTTTGGYGVGTNARVVWQNAFV
jgi:phage-related protein